MPFYPYLFYIISVCLIIAVILVVFTILKKRSAKKKQADAPQADDGAPVGPLREGYIQQLKASFAKQDKLLRKSVTFKDPLALVPWYLTIGAPGSGKTSAMNSIGNVGFGVLSDDKYTEDAEGQKACNWRFYKNAVVLDIKGGFLFSKDGLTSNNKEWDALLHLLQKHRPRRPLDGIVISINSADLIIDGAKESEILAAATQKAETLFERLWHLQRTLGVRLPVYILVTKCDQIKGYSSFCGALPEKNHDDIFGWSNPYAVEASYTSKWVTEALNSIKQDIFQTQVDIYAVRDDIANRDDLFMFPENFCKIKRPLQIYIDTIFKKSSYHDAFLMRGIYFTGSIGTENVTEPTVARPIFLNRLFDEKIFIEHGLARMPSSVRISRNKTILAAQILALVILITGVLGLSINFFRLKEDKQLLFHIIKPIENLRHQTHKHYKGDESVNLLNNMAKLKVSSFWSIFYPTSWFDHVNSEIVKTLTIAFDKIIMESLYKRLDEKAKRIAAGADKGVGEHYQVNNTAESGNFELPYETDAFINLKKYIAELQKLEENIHRYNKLQQEGEADFKDLEGLFVYLYGIKLPEGFYKRQGIYRNALAKARSRIIDIDSYMPATTLRAHELGDVFFSSIFRDSLLLRKTRELHDLSGKLVGSASFDQGVGATLRNFHNGIKQLAKLCSNPQFLWLTMPEFGFEPAFAETFSKYNTLKILKEGAGSKLLEKGQAEFSDFVNSIKEAELYFDMPIFEQGKKKFNLKLSPGMVALKKSLDNYFAIKPKQIKDGKMFKTYIPEGSLLLWNVSKLIEAVNLSESYSSFSTKGFEELSQAINTDIKNSLKSDIFNLLTQAQKFHTVPRFKAFNALESNLKKEIGNFKKAAKYLDKIIIIIKQNEFFGLQDVLIRLLGAQMNGLITNVDKMLKDAHLFINEENVLSDWNCDNEAAYEIFKVNSDKELKGLLQAQIDRLRAIISSYAEPIAANINEETALLLGPLESQKLSYLSSIVAVLRGYDDKQVDNELRALENYLRFDINDIKTANYLEKTTVKNRKSGPESFFSQIQEEYNLTIKEQCDELVAEKLIRSYNRIEDSFNRLLSGLFPFSHNLSSESGFYSEAEYEDVRHFFRMHINDMLQIIQMEPVFLDFADESGRHALQFVKQLKLINESLGIYSEKEKSEKQRKLALNLDVYFRVNQEYEEGVNHIIDWGMFIGDGKLKNKENKYYGVWRYGDDIELALRWAKDANIMPVPNQSNPGIKVEDKVVTFDFPGRWSLLKLLKKHQVLPADYVSNRDIIKPHTIKLSVDTIKKGGALVGGGYDKNNDFKSIVFLRINVSSLEGERKKPFILPDFPVSAPALQGIKIDGLRIDPPIGSYDGR